MPPPDPPCRPPCHVPDGGTQAAPPQGPQQGADSWAPTARPGQAAIAPTHPASPEKRQILVFLFPQCPTVLTARFSPNQGGGGCLDVARCGGRRGKTGSAPSSARARTGGGRSVPQTRAACLAVTGAHGARLAEPTAPTYPTERPWLRGWLPGGSGSPGRGGFRERQPAQTRRSCRAKCRCRQPA